MMRRKLWYQGIVHVLMPLCLFWCLLRDTLFWVIYIINRRMLFSVYLLNDIQFDLSMICCRLHKIVTKIVFSVYLLIVSPSIMIHQYFNFSRSILLVFCFVFCIMYFVLEREIHVSCLLHMKLACKQFFDQIFKLLTDDIPCYRFDLWWCCLGIKFWVIKPVTVLFSKKITNYWFILLRSSLSKCCSNDFTCAALWIVNGGADGRSPLSGSCELVSRVFRQFLVYNGA